MISGDAKAKLGKAIESADRARDARNWPSAVELYRAALELDKTLAPIWVQYGHSLKEAKKLDEAELAYQQALSLEPEVGDTHLQLGHLRKIMGRTRDAENDYIRALELDHNSRDARLELSRMGWSAARLRALLGKTAAPESTTTFIALELSDLVDFLQSARYPTGIQRVQMELARAFAESFGEDQVEFVYFDHGRYAWVSIDRHHIWDIVDLVENADRSNDARSSIAHRIKNETLDGPDYVFPTGCALVNPGTSWGYWNYFLAIRDAKKNHAIQYIPLVHDCIPLLFQEYCNPILVHDFINWLTGILTHGDLILTNSENTKSDFKNAAVELGFDQRACATIHLNGQAAETRAADATEDYGALDVMREHNLDVEDFVLFVSTIEPRKNHAIALSAWSRLLKSKRHQKIPRLICVGNTGWMNDEFYQRLSRDKALNERVVVLTNVSEHVLTLLYKRCLFTLFPSLYEGWGLPISEAIAHGKVPLVSNVSSHPEAGGDLSVYFDVNSETDFQAKLEQLIYDAAYRSELEQKIAAATPLRPWREIAGQVFTLINTLGAEQQDGPSRAAALFRTPPNLACGVYYSFARNSANQLIDVKHSGDVFRDGMSWHAPEYWGCWIKGKTADIAFSLAGVEGDKFLIYLHWIGSSNIDNTTVLSLPGSSWFKEVQINQEKVRWDLIPVAFGATSRREVRIRIASAYIDDFGMITGGRDTRVSSVGVKGIYVAAASDPLQRLAISEAIVQGDFEPLGRRFPQLAVL